MTSDRTDLQGDLAPTPPMGWNSWNQFTSEVNEEVMRATADAMVETGMRDAGYQYVVMDDYWSDEFGRDRDGNLDADPHKFPSGMEALADYVHSKGLKLGTYSDAAHKTCAGWPGSYGYEEQDAAQFAQWGIDFLKYDYCHAPEDQATAIDRYTRMGDALRKCGRPILYSVCEWGRRDPWLWARKAGGHMWRTTDDLVDKWVKGNDPGLGILESLDRNADLRSYSGKGGWNDPDMLVVGLKGTGRSGGSGCTEAEYRSHMSLWCMMAAPLMAAVDLRTADRTTLETLTNPEILAVDQDPLGEQGRRVGAGGGLEVWSKPLQGGSVAVCLFNRGAEEAKITARWEDLGLPEGKPVMARDLWAREEIGEVRESVSARVPSHGSVVIKLWPLP
jgi:alpha-galactosidase